MGEWKVVSKKCVIIKEIGAMKNKVNALEMSKWTVCFETRIQNSHVHNLDVLVVGGKMETGESLKAQGHLAWQIQYQGTKRHCFKQSER